MRTPRFIETSGSYRGRRTKDEGRRNRRVSLRPTTFHLRPRLEERSVAWRRRDPQVSVGRGRGDAAARRALEKTGLDEVRLVEILERAAILSQRRGQRAHADRAAAELFDDRLQDPAVELVKAVLVHLQPRERSARRFELERRFPGDLGEIAQTPQKPVRDPRRSAASAGDLARGVRGNGDSEDPRG